jgi:O-acetyl-ADP-ribose deacetylase (regulator of RNase III)
MSLKFIFFDRDAAKVQAYKEVLQFIPNCEFVHSDLDILLMNKNVNAIVSPANSYGFMNGGIDRDINRIMDNVEQQVKQRIGQVGIYDNSGRKFLPVGNCEVISKNNKFLFVSPTMTMPGYILDANNKNVFLAFYAILKKVGEMMKKYNYNLVIACPSLGTGVGNMDPKKSAMQVKYAFNLFFNQ